MADSARIEIEKLKSKIRYHERLYYVENNPEISDAEFDQLMGCLRELEEQNPKLKTDDSPTQRVGETVVDDLLAVEHNPSSPMLSLSNTYNIDDLEKFDERVKKIIGVNSFDYTAEPKIDGLGVSLVYKNNKFMSGATRGDGKRGDNISANLKTIRSVPLYVDSKEQFGRFEVRGEVFMRRKTFEEVNKQRKREGKPQFANARNCAAGSVRHLDPKITHDRNLDIMIYSLIVTDKDASLIQSQKAQSHSQAMSLLKAMGFKVPDVRAGLDLTGVLDVVKEYESKRSDLEYEIDGLVIKVDNYNYQQKLGATSKFPRWAIAFKYPAKQATTMVVDIKVQVGRTGALTPVADLQPILIAGSTVSRATLHNEDEIARKDIRIGDTVFIEKGGDVIPKIVSVILSKRTGVEKRFRMPSHCPYCGSTVFRIKGEAVSRCCGLACPAQINERVRHFVSRHAMDIENVGPALIEQLHGRKLISDPADIYHLTKEQLADLDRMAEVSALNVINSIEKSKHRPLERLVYSLGIRHIGVRGAQLLASVFLSMDNLINANHKDIENIHELGPSTAESVTQFFSQHDNLDMIEKLRSAKVNMFSDIGNAGVSLVGKHFVITGTLKNMTRNNAKNRVESQGGRVTSVVTQKTDYLVVGDNPGSKLRIAEKVGTVQLDEDTFLAMLGDV